MYILQEFQTSNNSTNALPIRQYTDKNEALSAYHTTLAAAYLSSVTVHTVKLCDEHGNDIEKKFVEHLPEVS